MENYNPRRHLGNANNADARVEPGLLAFGT
jgi:hypothetical protein